MKSLFKLFFNIFFNIKLSKRKLILVYLNDLFFKILIWLMVFFNWVVFNWLWFGIKGLILLLCVVSCFIVNVWWWNLG